SKELNANIQVKGVDIDLFKTIVLEDLIIYDLHNDTLLSVSKLKVDIAKLDYKTNTYELNKLGLESPIFHLRKYKGEKYNNMHFLIEYFSGPKDTTQKK